MPNTRAVIFASHGSDVKVYEQALRRVRCIDSKRVRSPDDISTDDSYDIAIVEIFDHRQASIANAHVADDASPGVRMLRAIRDRWPDCVVLGISHTSCINGSNYVEGTLLVDWVVAVNWSDRIDDPALNQESLVANALNRASEAHPTIKKLRLPEQCAVSNVQPAA